jgi:hypothetical protein
VSAVDPPVEVFAGASTERRTPGPPDVEVAASVLARELRVIDEPRTSLDVIGDHVEREDSSRRENLPPNLEAGSVYREARVDRRFGARLRTGEER